MDKTSVQFSMKKDDIFEGEERRCNFEQNKAQVLISNEKGPGCNFHSGTDDVEISNE